ncbi:MAG: glycosyltransferase [Balneola sp.]|nr:glycosyltransferase [Balneola sp.]MBO6650279.1 glycosyltransferase [Balneola sp.]MBO6712135.1 glycosyltransferase [Balneola sp.]MBO6800329.1 glycosyltransferase [Balneola sp.]MBO6869657.1 glycosyltransferase [Balneola sp.]
MKKGLVSIITPVYNGEDFLDRCIKSVLAQTYQNWELLLIDDGSVDDSTRIIEAYLADDRIKLLKNESNSGIPATRNKGIVNSSGEYIALLDQDDEWFPDKLQKQVQVFNEQGNVYGLIYSNLEVRYDNGDVTERKKEIEPEPTISDNLELMLLRNLISSPTVLIKKEVLDEVGLFDNSIKWGGDDYDLWIRIAHKYKFFYIDEVLSIRYEHQQNYSADKKRMMFRTIELAEKYIREFGVNPDIKKRLKSNHYYRFGIESLKKREMLTGVSYILKSIFVSKQGIKELVKTIRNRF